LRDGKRSKARNPFFQQMTLLMIIQQAAARMPRQSRLNENQVAAAY
jgi:hypothetical protein